MAPCSRPRSHPFAPSPHSRSGAAAWPRQVSTAKPTTPLPQAHAEPQHLPHARGVSAPPGMPPGFHPAALPHPALSPEVRTHQPAQAATAPPARPVASPLVAASPTAGPPAPTLPVQRHPAARAPPPPVPPSSHPATPAKARQKPQPSHTARLATPPTVHASASTRVASDPAVAPPPRAEHAARPWPAPRLTSAALPAPVASLPSPALAPQFASAAPKLESPAHLPPQAAPSGILLDGLPE